jgi:hypothetical protein
VSEKNFAQRIAFTATAAYSFFSMTATTNANEAKMRRYPTPDPKHPPTSRLLHTLTALVVVLWLGWIYSKRTML